jgi:hypothetical protein
MSQKTKSSVSNAQQSLISLKILPGELYKEQAAQGSVQTMIQQT